MRRSRLTLPKTFFFSPSISLLRITRLVSASAENGIFLSTQVRVCGSEQAMSSSQEDQDRLS